MIDSDLPKVDEADRRRHEEALADRLLERICAETGDDSLGASVDLSTFTATTGMTDREVKWATAHLVGSPGTELEFAL